MNPNSFGLLMTCLPKRAAPTLQYHASKDKLNHGPSCHPQNPGPSPLDRCDVTLSIGELRRQLECEKGTTMGGRGTIPSTRISAGINSALHLETRETRDTTSKTAAALYEQAIFIERDTTAIWWLCLVCLKIRKVPIGFGSSP
ncbi:hypothetical protein V1478_016173 [Vespula squamosa]|uniref:Uncharacterized protein n=1 Tax=Vespula squamosa TaxID=30214 RepID=A0ABD1ZZP4_VESSQ